MHLPLTRSPHAAVLIVPVTMLLEIAGTLSSSSSYVVEWQLRDQGDAGAALSQSGRPEAQPTSGRPQTGT